MEFVQRLAHHVRTEARVFVVSAVRPAVLAYSEVYVPAMAANEDVVKDQMQAGQTLRIRDVSFPAGKILDNPNGPLAFIEPPKAKKEEPADAKKKDAKDAKKK